MYLKPANTRVVKTSAEAQKACLQCSENGIYPHCNMCLVTVEFLVVVNWTTHMHHILAMLK